MSYVNFYRRNGEVVSVPTEYADDDVEISAAPDDSGIKRSPCSLRPDTWAPCELLTSPKDNDICYQCGLRQGRPTTNDTAEERKNLASALKTGPTISEPVSPEEPAADMEWPPAGSECLIQIDDDRPECVFEGCYHTATHCAGTLCEGHDMVVRTRILRGKSGAELYAPVRPRRIVK